MNARHRTLVSIQLVAACLLASCSGDDGSPTAAAQQSSVITGMAATGGALANAVVTMTNGTGVSPCREASISTSASGTYACTLKAAETAPFFAVVTDPAGNSPALVTATTSTPAAGATITLNATPLTTAILSQLASDGNALTLVTGHSVDAAALQQLTTNVVAQLINVLSLVGAPVDYSPFITAITAATASTAGNAADRVLDVVKVVTDPATGRLSFTTVGDPTPIALASATSAGVTVPAPVTAVAALPQAAQVVAQAFMSCFALPVVQRVLASDTTLSLSQGGPAVTSAAAACQDIAAETTNAGAIAFLHNGYSAGQWFYALLTSDSMTGATFSIPEIMAFYPAAATDSGQDEAVINIKYLDTNGNPGNVITVARDIPGSSSSARPSTWWLTGNQQLVDVNVRALIRRVEQSNPGSSDASRYQNGLQFLIIANGPGSVSPAGSLSYARVSGPGLPAAGLAFVAPGPAEIGQPYMDILNQTGTLTGTSHCFNCPNYWFSRTAGLTGSSATTLGANFGGPAWSPNGVDTTGVVKGRKYRIELFYGTSTSPTYTYRRALLTDLVPATFGNRLPWNSLSAASLAALDPTNSSLSGVLASITLSWNQNVAAEQIRSVNVNDAAGSYSAATQVPKGATSVLVTPTPSIPALTTTSYRSFLLHYRTLDNTDKTSRYSYN